MGVAETGTQRLLKRGSKLVTLASGASFANVQVNQKES